MEVDRHFSWSQGWWSDLRDRDTLFVKNEDGQKYVSL